MYVMWTQAKSQGRPCEYIFVLLSHVIEASSVPHPVIKTQYFQWQNSSFYVLLFSGIVIHCCYHHFLVYPYYPYLIQTTEQSKIIKFCQGQSKLIHLSSPEIQSGIYWQEFLTTETDANIWQPFADHPVHDTFLDSQLHSASRCSSPPPDDAGRLKPVVFDVDRM